MQEDRYLIKKEGKVPIKPQDLSLMSITFYLSVF